MKALIQKDLRENLKVALIGLLVFSLLLMQAYQSCNDTLANILRGNWSGQANALQPLLSMQLLVESAFACALFAAALGWLQTRNEAHRDLWAYLIHRPVTRTQIFWGKTIAGLCLYALGAGVPLLMLILVVRLPGHVATPFEWEMVVPIALIFLTGATYYFAGLLTGLRQARWYGSRCFGVGPALIASVGVFSLPQFWLALVLILVVTALVATAAWGAYQSGGWQLGQPLAGKAALTLTLSAGCVAVLAAGLALASVLIISPLTRSDDSHLYTSYQITREGGIYQITTRDNDMLSIVDLAGHPLLDPKTGRPMDRKEFNNHFSSGNSVYSNFKALPRRNFTEDNSRYFHLVGVTDKTLWYLDRHGKLTGYYGPTRKYVGTLAAPAGDGTVPEPFWPYPSGYSYNYYNSYSEGSQKLFANTRTVYRVNFKDRTVIPVFTAAPDDEINACGDEAATYDDNTGKRFLLTTRKHVLLLNSAGETVFTVPYQPGFFEYPRVQISFLKASNSFALWFHPDYELNRQAHYTMPTHVKWIGPESAITKGVDLPELQQSYVEPWTDKLMTAITFPPAFLVLFAENINGTWRLFSAALAAMCAAIAGILVRRHNGSPGAAVGWMIFALLLGVPALLALFCIQEWPVREACPACQKPRAVDHENCEHCAAAFPPPQKNGTEIFAPLVKI